MILQRLSSPLVAARESIATSDLDQINSLPNPPLVPLTENEIHVRRCRLAGDAVDSQFGCFRTGDLPRLLQLANGAPAMIGHNRVAVPVARFFGGSVEEHQGHHYIVPKFYWPRGHSASNDFRVLLDSGIISEASLAFTFDKPACSVCGKDLRECEHEPGTLYGLRLCFYYYEGLDRVLEGSFVYRGAEPGTGILAEISELKRSLKSRKTITVKIGGRIYEAIAPLAS